MCKSYTNNFKDAIDTWANSKNIFDLAYCHMDCGACCESSEHRLIEIDSYESKT